MNRGRVRGGRDLTRCQRSIINLFISTEITRIVTLHVQYECRKGHVSRYSWFWHYLPQTRVINPRYTPMTASTYSATPLIQCSTMEALVERCYAIHLLGANLNAPQVCCTPAYLSASIAGCNFLFVFTDMAPLQV